MAVPSKPREPCRCAELVRHERELRERGEAASEVALRLQAEELSRRLEILNGHQQELAADRNRFVVKDTYLTWQDQVNQMLATARGRDKGLGIAWAIALGGLGLLIGVAGLAVSILTKP